MNAYIYFLKESLGIDSFIAPVSYNDTKSAAEDFAVYIEGDGFSQPELELLNKILSAISSKAVKATHYYVAEGTEIRSQAKITICFLKNINDQRIGKVEFMNSNQVYYTYHLQTMLENLDYKKTVWSHLQKIKQLLE